MAVNVSYYTNRQIMSCLLNFSSFFVILIAPDADRQFLTDSDLYFHVEI